MIIGIDGNEANVSQRVGVGQFSYHLLFQLHQNTKQHQFHIYLKSEPLPDLPQPNPNWHYHVFGPKNLWTKIALPLHLFTGSTKLDVFYSPHHYSPHFSPFPTVPTILDLGYLHYPKQFTRRDLDQLISWTANSIKKAKHIITISEFTKNEITKTYRIPQEKITVIYMGTDTPPPTDTQSMRKILLKYNLKKQCYFLSLGTLKPNKNIPFLLESFSVFTTSAKYRYFKLVIAGKKGWLYDQIFATVKKLNLENQVTFTDYITEKEKWILLKNATSLVIPSLYEGFGIPAVESQKIGVPVIVSNVGSLPEIIGSSGIIIDPLNHQSLVTALTSMSNPRINQKYSSLGLINAQRFSWQNTSSAILNCLQNCIISS